MCIENDISHRMRWGWCFALVSDSTDIFFVDFTSSNESSHLELRLRCFQLHRTALIRFCSYVLSFSGLIWLMDEWMNVYVSICHFQMLSFFSVFLSLFSDSTLQSIYLNHFLSSSILYLHHSISLPVYEKVKIKLTDPVIPLPSPRLPRKRHYWKTQHLLKS